ncbi:hypothetical protein MGYG_02093 [Nannizzia gypsea CBS 118893]|uniref:Uncharacterized protein n=1 Tax=Arthroderma gypseum (strain ATCC MYA-4604 / CBS 118893) TaxID=535722 RepID=E4UPP2_ARTGP|nr:hypothetical protein MGYG_02093 [Nannizzia gypsea CBS 118893]EFQ99079.1 hypothetical protein MGYG_02093 [Nannizzia gypsea CBS 118893]
MLEEAVRRGTAKDAIDYLSWLLLPANTTYNAPADDQSERTNLSTEVPLRCLLVGKYESSWHSLIPDVQRYINLNPTTWPASRGFCSLKERHPDGSLSRSTTGHHGGPGGSPGSCCRQVCSGFCIFEPEADQLCLSNEGV